MPKQVRHWTKYAGVYYVDGRGAGGKAEKLYYVVYRRQGKLIEEKAGRERQDDMTPARAAGIRAKRIDGEELPNIDKRHARQEAKQRENPWTVNKLWEEYEKSKSKSKSLVVDKYRYIKYLKDTIGNKEPHKVVLLDIDRLQRRDLKDKSPQTVKHVLALLLRLIHFGIQRSICQPLPFSIAMPRVNNQKTEDLTHAQLKALMKALDDSPDIMTVNIMRMAMYTGMRRGELFKLQWQDIDFERGFITIRHDPKGGKDTVIPLNKAAREVLLKHPRQPGQDLIFYRNNGKPFTDIARQTRKITNAAGIPQDFRPLHGLRHHFASSLASSGKVDLYVLQRLLTHKNPQMTQRYSHLRDQALRQASDLAGELFRVAEKETNDEEIAQGGEA
jgi:integrase